MAHNSTGNNAAVYGPRRRTVSGGSFPRSWSLVHALETSSTRARPDLALSGPLRASPHFSCGGKAGDRPERKGSAAQNTYVTVTNLSRWGVPRACPSIVKLLNYCPVILAWLHSVGGATAPFRSSFSWKGPTEATLSHGEETRTRTPGFLVLICRPFVRRLWRPPWGWMHEAPEARRVRRRGEGLYDAARHVALSSVLSPCCCSRSRGPPCR